jgi:hypothetical protein
MDAYELAEWEVLYQIEPWGDYREDLRSALQTAHLMDVHRDRKKRALPFQPKDFLLTFKEQEEDTPTVVAFTDPEKMQKAQQVVSQIEARRAQIRLKRLMRGKAA